MLYFVLLYTKRDIIALAQGAASTAEVEDAASKVAYARFLFDSYKPPCMYFEVIECVRKLLLTGMLIFFFPCLLS